jgi:4-amino-4-deoxy-L-arabinose transferase-like glycosyltransferase
MSSAALTANARTGTVLALLVFISCAYFYQAGGWNQNSRFALVRALLEEHTVRIDAYREHTGDRALWKGHTYSDKAPGASLLALPSSAVARAIGRSAGVDPASMRGVVWTSYIASISTAALFTALATAAVYALTLRWGASRGGAVFAATAYALAGPAWAYGTVFVGHNVTAGCLVLAFAAAVALETASPRGRAGLALTFGLLCGLAVLVEFPAAVPVLILVTFAGLTIRRVDRGRTATLSALVVAGGALMAAVLLAYHAAAFDSPFRLGYGSEDNVEGATMQQGLFGISHPTLHAAYEVLLGTYRGLLPISPLVALAPVGLVLVARPSQRRPGVVTCAAIAAFYVLLNVSYTFWEGGWFYGPRHLVPGLPFLALGLAPLWDRRRRWLRAVLIGGWLWGAAVNLIAVSTTVQPPSDIMAPVADLMWPAFREGDLALNTQSFVDYLPAGEVRRDPMHHAGWNLGQLVGLRGLASLLPLVALWIAAAVLIFT